MTISHNYYDSTIVLRIYCCINNYLRGGIPENTLVAIRESEQNGAVAIEVDLAFTKDRHPVILHDETVDRTSNGSGKIVALMLEDVKQLDFGSHAG